jgi:RepB DNA-primase from phage plasmid
MPDRSVAPVSIVPSISNEVFLRAVFGDAFNVAHVCAFGCAPGEAGHLWAGGRWRDIGASFSPTDNAYFAISTFDPEPGTGRARRVKAAFRATHAIVLDDVGSKTDPRVVAKLPFPSWKLETSPGNQQWGYILDVPETDAGIVNALLDGLVAAGLCPDGKDPGMKGVTRYVRLPVGRNTKAKYGAGGFACRLTEWHRERRFTPVELAAPVGVVLPEPGATPATRSRGTAARADAENDVIYRQLVRWGMIDGSRTSDGGYHCECPWIGEHTGTVASGSAYWLNGGFKCHHGHCETRNRGDLIQWVDARLRAEGMAGLASCDFKDADKPTVDAFWRVLASRRSPTSHDITCLAAVPNVEDVNAMLGAASVVLGTNLKAVRRRLAIARHRVTRQAIEDQERHTVQAACGDPVVASADWVMPIPLAEAQALTEHGVGAILTSFMAGTCETIPLRRRGRRR